MFTIKEETTTSRGFLPTSKPRVFTNSYLYFDDVKVAEVTKDPDLEAIEFLNGLNLTKEELSEYHPAASKISAGRTWDNRGESLGIAYAAAKALGFDGPERL